MLSNEERSHLIELLDQRGEANQALRDFLKGSPGRLDATDSHYWELESELRARSEAVETYLGELRATHRRSVTVV